MFPDGKLVRLINEEKVDGYEGTTKRKFYKWYLNFDCDYKQEVDGETGEIKDIPINFFNDETLSGKLNTLLQVNEDVRLLRHENVVTYSKVAQKEIYKSKNVVGLFESSLTRGLELSLIKLIMKLQLFGYITTKY